MVESSRLLADDADAGDLWLSKYASNLNRQYGATVAERMKYLEDTNVDPDFTTVVDKFIQVCDHGVVEELKVICSGCGASTEITVSVDALSFFPNL
jgi:hypothetical protein